MKTGINIFSSGKCSLYAWYTAENPSPLPMDVFKVRDEAEKAVDLTHAPDWVKDDFAAIKLLYSIIEKRAKGVVVDEAEIIKLYSELWLKQNREGGLNESIKCFIMYPASKKE